MSAGLVDTYCQALCRGDVEGRAVILWCATVAGTWVEASEVLSLGEGAITRVDAFLRPAEVLGSVYEAMVRSWPDR